MLKAQAVQAVVDRPVVPLEGGGGEDRFARLAGKSQRASLAKAPAAWRMEGCRKRLPPKEGYR